MGVIGVWDIGCDLSKSLSGGIYKFRPHIRNIAKLHGSRDRHRLLSASYDGTIRRLDLNTESFELLFMSANDGSEGFCDADFSETNNELALVGLFNGSAGLVDYRMSRTGYVWMKALHDSKINSIQQHPTDDNYFITASGGTGGMISIWDCRRLSMKAVNVLSYHSKSINAATVSPDGRYLVSVSLDDTVKVSTDFLLASLGTKHDPVGVPGLQTASVRHNNFTGRWLSTFRPVFDPKLSHTFVLGSMTQPRCIEVFTPSATVKGSIRLDTTAVLRAEFLASVCSRNAFHPTLNVIAGGNSSGRVHIFK
jgi:WD40 repeat protein